MDVLLANLAISAVGRCRNHLDNLLSARYHRKSRIWRWNLDSICQSSRDVITSGFGEHIEISGYRSPLYLLANISLYLYMVSYHRFVVVIWNFNCIFHRLRDVSISGFGRHFRLSLTIGIAYVHYLRVCHRRMP